jgi:hypothetical protein
MKIYLAAQRLLVGDRQTYTHRDTKTGDFINLLSFLESRLNKQVKFEISFDVSSNWCNLFGPYDIFLLL